MNYYEVIFDQIVITRKMTTIAAQSEADAIAAIVKSGHQIAHYAKSDDYYSVVNTPIRVEQQYEFED